MGVIPWRFKSSSPQKVLLKTEPFFLPWRVGEMKKADIIFRNAEVVTVNRNFDLFHSGAVAVSGNSIAAVGSDSDICREYTAAETVDCGGKALLPGLVNTHTHLPMNLLRGLSDDRKLDEWLGKYIMPAERLFVNREFCRIGTEMACAELIRGGVTCFADMYYFEDTVLEAAASAGLRGIGASTVLMFPSPDSSGADEGLCIAEDFILRFREHPLVVPAVGPHAPYTTTPEILARCAELARKYDVPVLMHLAETAGEREDILKKYGKGVVSYAGDCGLLDTKLVGAHLVHVDREEMKLLASHGCGAAFNPGSNLKLVSGFPKITGFLEEGVRTGLGTDGAASNNDLDMFEEMRLAALVEKLMTGNPEAVPARDVLRMATLGGAEALFLDGITGSVEEGKRADLVLVDINTPHNSPCFEHNADNIYSRLVYATKSGDVTDVLTDGKWLMRDRKLLTLDEGKILAEAGEISRAVSRYFLEN